MQNLAIRALRGQCLAIVNGAYAWVDNHRSDHDQPRNPLPDTIQDETVPREIQLYDTKISLSWIRKQISFDTEVRYANFVETSAFIDYNRQITAKAIDDMWIRWLAKIESCKFPCDQEDKAGFIVAAQSWNLHTFEMRSQLAQSCRNQEEVRVTFDKESLDFTSYGLTAMDGYDEIREQIVLRAQEAEDWDVISPDPISIEQLNRLGPDYEFYPDQLEEDDSDTTFEAIDDYDMEEEEGGWAAPRSDPRSKLEKMKKASAQGKTIVEMFGGTMETKRSTAFPRRRSTPEKPMENLEEQKEEQKEEHKEQVEKQDETVTEVEEAPVVAAAQDVNMDNRSDVSFKSAD